MLTDKDFTDPTPSKDDKWWDNPPKDLETQLHVLQVRAHKLRSPDDEGKALRALLANVEQVYQDTQKQIKEQYPIAFFKPSYEQSLLLNCWWCGIDFPTCFAANRIGKTAALGVINPCLNIFGNNPDWEMFAATTTPNPADEGETLIDNPLVTSRYYLDLFNRPVQTLSRPTWSILSKLKKFLKEHPELIGNPMFSHLDPINREKFATLQSTTDFLQPCWPASPIPENGEVWLGAPDNEFHEEIILKEWRRWIPAHSIKEWSDTQLKFTLTAADTTNPNNNTWDFLCKSYESKDTKWSGAAVNAIILTEGLTLDILSEVRQRIKVNGFGSWDYTPYEATNVGAKTALAFKVFKGQETLPLRSHIFTNFSARKAPAHVLPLEKRDDLIRMWDGKKEGEARLDGLFYSTSPLILSRLERAFHCVPWSTQELFDRYPLGQLYRGFDPGYDHPAACCWALLAPGNIWFIYRYYVERGTTIAQRCKDIVTLSGNTLRLRKLRGRTREQSITILQEAHLSPTSEIINLTAADFHAFKQDEVTGAPYILNYTKAGLILTESTHMRPEDRAVEIDNKLDRSPYHVHPITNHTPGCRIFFLINGQGVDAALGKMESLFWDRLHSGPNKGEAKDKVPTHKDDELDATCYLVCGLYTWTNFRPTPNNHFPEDDEEDFATMQTRQPQASLLTY